MNMMTRFLALFMVIAYMLQSCHGSNSSYGCKEAERNALLTFKQSFSDPGGKLSSWDGMHCCQWDGVGCDLNTGYVIKLDLRSLPDFGYVNGVMPSRLQASKLDSSLLKLRYLNYLDLSGNNFNYSGVPEFLGEMNGLKYLNLSYASFTIGLFPLQLGNLTNLQLLDLSNTNLSGVRNLFTIFNKLPFLSVLSLTSCELDDAQLSPTTNSNLTFLSSVQDLHLSYNNFFSFPLLLKNMSSSVRVLDLSFNRLNSSIPMWLTDLKDLEYLDLSVNEFNKVEGGLGRILWGLCHLKTFDFSRNNLQRDELNRNVSVGCSTYELEELKVKYSGLTGVLPDELCRFTKLKYLDLSYNALHGSIHALIGNLPGLIEINLNSNQLNDTIPVSLGNLLSLHKLDLFNNSLYGAIPKTIGNLTALTKIDLSENQLSGVVPDSIGQLFNLEFLGIYSNYLTGKIYETHFLNATKLRFLMLSSNQLTISFTPDWIPPFQLFEIDMRSCKIGTMFPRWIETQKRVEFLDLSNASITGPWPKWFQSSSLLSIDLSHNEITGHIPYNIADLLPALQFFYLSGSRMYGTIPSSFCKMKSLTNLDISRNMLSGEIPNCWENTNILYALKLSYNKLTGVIPNSIGNLSFLRWLQLNNNRLKGEIHSSLRYHKYLVFLNLADNGFSGNISTWIGEKEYMQILVFRNNTFAGYIPNKLCQLHSLQILDLAYNNFTGSIPSCLGSLTAMTVKPLMSDYGTELEEENEVMIKRMALEYKSSLSLVVNMDLSSNNLVGVIPTKLTLLSQLLGLNLSYNHLTGTIPKNIRNLTALESLDLSNNQLYGIIPIGLSLLQSLSSLNLSYNNFSGQIPTGNQLKALPDPSIYDGNPNLCGFPLPKRCDGDEQVLASVITDEEDDKSDKVWLYLAISIGYAFGLWAFFGILMFKKKWRYAYFRYVDNAKDWVYVFIVVNARRLKRKMTGGEE